MAGLALETLRPVALAGIAAPHTRRAYGTAMSQFALWYAERRADLGPVTKAVVGAYSEWLQARGLAAATVAQRLSAVRRLFLEAADAGAFDAQTAQAIGRVKGPKKLGRRLGKWLSLEEARRLVNAPLEVVDGQVNCGSSAGGSDSDGTCNVGSGAVGKGIRPSVATGGAMPGHRRILPPLEGLKRYRDRAVLAVLIGCGLRRSECAGLRWSMLQQRDGRWCLVDVVGKGGRIRTVPVPSWTVAALEEWRGRLGIEGTRGRESELLGDGRVLVSTEGGVVFPSLNHGRVQPTAISADGIDELVRHWSAAAGCPIAAHDLRRTHAKLARRGGVDLEQLQYALGHASIQTTQVYVGENQRLEKGPGDFIDL